MSSDNALEANGWETDEASWEDVRAAYYAATDEARRQRESELEAYMADLEAMPHLWGDDPFAPSPPTGDHMSDPLSEFAKDPFKDVTETEFTTTAVLRPMDSNWYLLQLSGGRERASAQTWPTRAAAVEAYIAGAVTWEPWA